METLEKQQLQRAIDLLRTNIGLCDFGEQLPAEVRQLGIAQTLMKHSRERALADILINEINTFDPTLFTSTDDLLAKALKLNNLPIRTSLMLHEHLFSFAEEFRKVAKVLTAQNEPTRL